MDQSNEIKCPRCGGTVSTVSSGSITQWVARCACKNLLEEDKEAKLNIEICVRCSKRIGRASREGSFTQWIFKDDLCTCAAPESLQVSLDSIILDRKTLEQSDPFITPPPVEALRNQLEVDPEKFPVDRYDPISILGSGSAGSVYLCFDRILARKVAIKILSTLTPDQLVAFHKEAKAASRLTHANIVQVQDFGTTPSGFPYMVMEFIDGTNLYEVIKQQGPLDERTAIAVFKQICQGLEESHKQGVFHRDIKSSNILVAIRDSNPEVRIIDFGVSAVMHADDSQAAQSKTLVGTPHYMSPDQAVGKSYDARSEIYSLGCTLFEALTGSPPFSAHTALEVIQLHAIAPLPTLSERRPDLEFSTLIEDVIKRSLAKDPEDRFSSMAAFATALEPPRSSIIEQSYQSLPRVESVAVAKTPWIIGILLFIFFAGSIASFLVFMPKPLTEEQAHKESDMKPENKFKQTEDIMPEETLFTRNVWNSKYPTISANRHAGLTDDDLRTLSGEKRLYMLDLGRSLMDGTGLRFMPNTIIECVSLDKSPVTAAGIRQVAKTKGTVKVVLLGCDDITDEDLSPLAEMPALKMLAIAGKRLTERSFEVMAKSPTLTTCEVYNMHFSKEGISNLLRTPKLRNLTIYSSTFTPEAWSMLAKSQRGFDYVAIYRQSYTDNELQQFIKLPSKRILFGECELTRKAFAVIEKKPKVHFRRLSCEGQTIPDRWTKADNVQPQDFW